MKLALGRHNVIAVNTFFQIDTDNIICKLAASTSKSFDRTDDKIQD